MSCSISLPPVNSGWLRIPPLLIVALFVFIFLMLFQSVSHAQLDGPYTITRVEEQRTMYVFPDSLLQYPIAERIALLPQITRDSVIVQVFANSDFKTTIFHLENDRVETWLNAPAKTVMDKKFTKVFDASNALLYSYPHSPAYKDAYLALKTQMASTSADIVPDYVALTPTLKTTLLSYGFTATNIGGGTWRFSHDSLDIFYNNAKKTNELHFKYADGSVRRSVFRDFRVNALGQTVPALVKESIPATGFGDACIEKLIITEYPIYSISVGPLRETVTEQVEQNVQVFPNPAVDIISFTRDVSISGAEIILCDISGIAVMTLVFESGSDSMIADISALPPGMYAAIYQENGETRVLRIVKQ